MVASFVVVFGTSVGALAALLTSLATLVTVLRNTKRTNEIHVLVNSRMNDMVTRVEQLTKALEDADKEVPAELPLS